MSELLIRSRHLSWFCQRGALYLYHDLFGDILEMSPDLKAVVDAFARPCPASEARALVPGLDEDLYRHAIDSFVEHACLLPAGTDELFALRDCHPYKSPWIVVHTDSRGSVSAVVGRCSDETPRLICFDDEEAQIWRWIDGEHRMDTIARLAFGREPGDPELDRVVRSIARWTHSDLQLTRVHRLPASFFRHAPMPSWLRATMPFERLDAAPREAAREAVIDLRRYHREEIVDAAAQFDEVETTLSHLFRVPHVALGGRSWAEALLDVLLERGLLRVDARELLEVGGGTGILAGALLDRLQQREPGLYRQLHYRVVDISPTLHRAQLRQLARHPCAGALIGDGEALDIASESIDLLLSNEVIADFRSARMTLTRSSGAPDEEGWVDPDEMLELLEEEEPLTEIAGPPEALELLHRYGIDVGDAPEAFLFNVGAIRLMEGIGRVLRPGGSAVLIEFGDRWRYPVELTHLDHAEVSIHFGHLLQVAERIGLDAELVDVFDLLGFDGDHETLHSTRAWFRNLGVLLRSCGIELSKIAWTRESFAELCAGAIELDQIEFLHWSRLEERVMGLRPREFKALILRKGIGDRGSGIRV